MVPNLVNPRPTQPRVLRADSQPSTDSSLVAFSGDHAKAANAELDLALVSDGIVSVRLDCHVIITCAWTNVISHHINIALTVNGDGRFIIAKPNRTGNPLFFSG